MQVGGVWRRNLMRLKQAIAGYEGPKRSQGTFIDAYPDQSLARGGKLAPSVRADTPWPALEQSTRWLLAHISPSQIDSLHLYQHRILAGIAAAPSAQSVKQPGYIIEQSLQWELEQAVQNYIACAQQDEHDSRGVQEPLTIKHSGKSSSKRRQNS